MKCALIDRRQPHCSLLRELHRAPTVAVQSSVARVPQRFLTYKSSRLVPLYSQSAAAQAPTSAPLSRSAGCSLVPKPAPTSAATGPSLAATPLTAPVQAAILTPRSQQGLWRDRSPSLLASLRRSSPQCSTIQSDIVGLLISLAELHYSAAILRCAL